MTGREFAKAIREGKHVFGTYITSPAPRWPDVVKKTGVDFVFIDTEHTPNDRSTVSWMCQTYKAIGLPPVVRVTAPDPYQACAAVDGGACGVVMPYIETARQVKDLVGAVKFRPIKGKRLKQILDDPATLDAELAQYIDQFNYDTAVIANIESVPAIENLDEILGVPGLDAVQVGPHDLSVNMGIPEQYDHPRFDEAIREIITKARAKGVGACVHFFWEDMEQEIEWIRAGANMHIHGADVRLFETTLRRNLENLRAALGQSNKVADAKEATIV